MEEISSASLTFSKISSLCKLGATKFNLNWARIRSQQGGVSATNSSNTQNSVTFPFSNQESCNYFEREHLHGLGKAYLVANSQFKLNLVAPNLHKEDILLKVKLAELISSMTLGQQTKFTEVMY